MLIVKGATKDVEMKMDQVTTDVVMTTAHLSKQLTLQPSNVSFGTPDVKKFGSLLKVSFSNGVVGRGADVKNENEFQR